MLKSWWPTHCLVCLQKVDTAWPVDHLCQGCFDDLPWNTPACLTCAEPLPTAQPYCAHCLTQKNLQQFSYILFHYTSPISDWIHAAKFQKSFLHCRLLGQLVSHALAKQRTTPWPQSLIPMPLHVRRLRQRGYNQTLEIARTICKNFKMPMEIKSLQRHRYSKPQRELRLKERHSNVQESFSLKNALPSAHLALFDDVSTTGSTLKAAAKALLKTGPLQLEYWCIAKPF